jgi:kojibiose phosphorylase
MVPTQWIFPDTGEIEILYLGDQEIHTSLAVAYAVQHYHISTGDQEFLRSYGLELMLESALFYATRAELNNRTGEYEIRNVTGPDEHHSNANNSAYINTLARWSIRSVLRYLDDLERSDPALVAKLRDKTQVTDKDVALMKAVAEKIRINFDPKTKLIEQFDGFFKLKNLYSNTPNIMPGEKPGAQIVKQADVVLLMCLFPDTYDAETKKANYEYYEPHTDHLSSLSAGAHAVLAANIGKPEEAYDFFMQSSMIDLKSEKGDCIEGIHIASCGGAWQAVVFGFAGLKITENGLSIDPHLPEKWRTLSFKIVYNGNLMSFTITRSEIRIETTAETEVNIYGEHMTLAEGTNVFPRT